MAKRTPLEQVREMLDDCDGVSFGNIGAHLDEITTVCDRALAEQADLVKALKDAQRALAMTVSPEAIKITSVMSAYAQAVEAEAAARAALTKAGAGQ